MFMVEYYYELLQGVKQTSNIVSMLFTIYM